jgi:hypothetical protein
MPTQAAHFDPAARPHRDAHEHLRARGPADSPVQRFHQPNPAPCVTEDASGHRHQRVSRRAVACMAGGVLSMLVALLLASAAVRLLQLAVAPVGADASFVAGNRTALPGDTQRLTVPGTGDVAVPRLVERRIEERGAAPSAGYFADGEMIPFSGLPSNTTGFAGESLLVAGVGSFLVLLALTVAGLASLAFIHGREHLSSRHRYRYGYLHRRT